MSEIEGIPPPDTQPGSAIPIPAPPSIPFLPSIESSSSSSTRSSVADKRTLLAWVPLYLKQTDRVVARLNKVLSTPSGTDSLLNAVCYTSLLSSVLLTKIANNALQSQAQGVIAKATKLPEGTHILVGTGLTKNAARSLELAGRLKALSKLISEFRTFTRLFGLLSLWAWGKRVLIKLRSQEGERDTVGLGIEVAQVAVNVCYQVLENGAYLSGKGILGWSKSTQASSWVWSSRFWGAHVFLDLIRLAREYKARQTLEIVHAKEWKGSSRESDKEFEMRWTRQLCTNAAYAPLTVHWGLEGGLVGELWVGILGSVAGGLGCRENWRKSGLEILA